MIKKIKIALSVILVFSLLGCSYNISVTDDNNRIGNIFGSTNSDSITNTPESAASTPAFSPTPTITPTPEPAEEPKVNNAKYVFILIGDGLGYGTLELGNLYQKIYSGDPASEGAWENLPLNVPIKAGADSSQGGSLIATGARNKSGYISQDAKGNHLTTILDICKANGMLTGVVTQSSLVDATPAAFLVHNGSRENLSEMSLSMIETDVDLILGGGLERMYSPEDFPEEYMLDAKGKTTTVSLKKYNNAVEYENRGYTTYLAMKGAIAFNGLDMVRLPAFGAFTYGDFAYTYITKYPGHEENMLNQPSLEHMTSVAINSLYNENEGFCLVTEAANIDNAIHKSRDAYVAAELGVLNDTLEIILEFYNKHPENTTVIVTSDHETGHYLYKEGVVDTLSKVSELVPWGADKQKIRDYFNDYHDLWISSGVLSKYDPEAAYSDNNRILIASNITAYLMEHFDIIRQSDQHSRYKVPLMALGNGYQMFGSCTLLEEVPHVICKVLGYEDTLDAFMDDTDDWQIKGAVPAP